MTAERTKWTVESTDNVVRLDIAKWTIWKQWVEALDITTNAIDDIFEELWFGEKWLTDDQLEAFDVYHLSSKLEELYWKRQKEFNETYHTDHLIDIMNRAKRSYNKTISKLNNPNWRIEKIILKSHLLSKAVSWAKWLMQKMWLPLMVPPHVSNKQDLHDALENLFYVTVSVIGVLNKNARLPLEKKTLYPDNIDIIKEIKSKWWTLKLWLNGYIVPWSLDSIIRLLKKWVIQHDKIKIIAWNWVNFQEWITFVKCLEDMDDPKSSFQRYDNKDRIDKIEIIAWNDASFAHWGSVYWVENPETWNYEITLKIWNGSFLGINSLVWSWTEIWNNSTIWFGCRVWHHCKIWNDVIIWQWVDVEPWTIIKDNCLIPHWSTITPNSPVIPFEKYDNTKTNCIIQLAWDELTKQQQLKSIGDVYTAIKNFNKHNVVPENKAFATIDMMLKFIDENFPESNIYCVYKFENCLLDNDILERTGWEYMAKDKSAQLYLQAYPKDKIKFMFEQFPYILKCAQTWKKLWRSYFDKIFERPRIGGKHEEMFIENNSIVGKCEMIGKSLSIGSYIRSDERTNKDCHIVDSTLVRCVSHGWWEQLVRNSTVIKMCVHWATKILNSIVWELGLPSVVNATTIIDSTAEWRLTTHNVVIEKSKLPFRFVKCALWKAAEKINEYKKAA